MKTIRYGALATVCAANLAIAQEPAQQSEGWLDRHIRVDSVSINTVNGAPRAYAPRYEAEFGEREFEFIPVTDVVLDGPTVSLGLTLDSIGRSDGATIAVARGKRMIDGLQVRYRRPSFDEIYDARRDGVEQSFEFRSLPSGAGDLVVRMRVTTELVAQSDEWTDGGIELVFDELQGHATIGAVTGIDANGRRVGGAMRLRDGMLEFSLPGEFVANAALPLVLDPFITAAFEGSANGRYYTQRDADVAYDASADVYCVVWERILGGTVVARARGFDSAGSPVFSVTGVVAAGGISQFNPRIANIAVEDAFVVVFSAGGDVRAGALRTNGSSLNFTGINVAATSDFESAADIGGEATLLDNEALAVWWNITRGRIEATQITVDGSTFSVFGSTTFPDGGGQHAASNPAISKTGGSTGHHLITYQRALPGDSEIRGSIVTRNLSVFESDFPITFSNRNDQTPDCDGDGLNWVVTWQRDESSSAAVEDILAAPVSLDQARLDARVGVSVVIAGDQLEDEQNPSVAWLGTSALIGFAQRSPAGPDIYDGVVQPIDPFTCRPTANQTIVESSAFDQDCVAIGAAFDGHAASGQAAVVWDERHTSTNVPLVRARLWESRTGIVTDLGGGCGGGTAYATSINVGNASFVHRLHSSQVLTPAGLILSFDRLDARCSVCSLIANPITGLVLGTSTNSSGQASFPMTIPPTPSLVGATFYDQWLIPGPRCPLLGASFSNAIRVTIQ